MSLFEILNKEYELIVNPLENFSLVDLAQYFDEEENRYKHIRGVVSQMQLLVNDLKLPEEEKRKAILIAYLHDIGYSKRVKNRGHHALDGAIFALEHAFSEEVALAIMFHTAAYGEVKKIGGKLLDIYNKTKPLVDENEKVKKYIEFITYCDLRTESDGTPTTAVRRIFKILSRYEKNSNVYKNIKKHRRYFIKLEKRIRSSVIKEKTFFEKMGDILKAQEIEE